MTTNGEFKIEKGVPIPPGRPRKSPLWRMEVGDSFAVPINGRTPRQVQSRTSAHATYIKSLTGRRFTVRTLPDEIRVWRIA